MSVLRPLLALGFAAALALPRTASAGGPANDQWIDVDRLGDVVYLLRPSPAQVLRFDLATQAWLPPLPLDVTPSAFVVAPDAFYVAAGTQIRRYGLDGANGTTVGSAGTVAYPILELHVDGPLLFAVHPTYNEGVVTSFDRVTHAPLGNIVDYPWSFTGTSISTVHNRILGSGRHHYPGDVYFASYRDDGTLPLIDDTPYHGDLPRGERTWVSPDGQRLIDSSGTEYRVSDLVFTGSLGAPVLDVAYAPDGTLYSLRGNVVRAHHPVSRAELGQRTLPLAGGHLALRGDTLFVFQDDSSEPGGIAVQDLPTGSFVAAPTVAPVDPQGLAYAVTEATIDPAGRVYLLAAALRHVFVWDLHARAYVDAIPLPSGLQLTHLAYAAAPHALFLSDDRFVYRIDLDEATPTARPHAQTGNFHDRLTPVDDALLVWTSFSNGVPSFMLRLDGTPAQMDPVYGVVRYYDPLRQRLYHQWLVSDYLGDGMLSYGRDLTSPVPFALDALWLSPDGERSLGTSGRIYHPFTAAQLHQLENPVTAGGWLADDHLITLRSGDRALQRWSPGYVLLDGLSAPGSDDRLLLTADRVVVVTVQAGVPSFTVLDGSLNDPLFHLFEDGFD